MNQPNIIFICTDQQRSDSLGCYGNQCARTPNIDSIAVGGMRFNRHTTPMQICSPSLTQSFHQILYFQMRIAHQHLGIFVDNVNFM